MTPKTTRDIRLPDIFTYLDYRTFLKDAFAAMRTHAPKLSFRAFAARAGFSTPNFFQQVIQGKRNLGSANAVMVARAYGLGREETEFFRSLVGFGQARTADEKNLFYRQIHRNKRYAAVKTLEKHQYDYYSQWYNTAVRELATQAVQGREPAWIAERLFPRVAVSQVEASLRLLEQLGLLERTGKSGPWRQVDAVIATESESAHLATRNYHRSAIQLAHEAIKHFPPADRDIRAVTLGLTRDGFADLKSLMEEYWRKILDLAGSQVEPDLVYQVNLQLFPLTKEKD